MHIILEAAYWVLCIAFVLLLAVIALAPLWSDRH